MDQRGSTVQMLTTKAAAFQVPPGLPGQALDDRLAALSGRLRPVVANEGLLGIAPQEHLQRGGDGSRLSQAGRKFWACAQKGVARRACKQARNRQRAHRSRTRNYGPRMLHPRTALAPTQPRPTLIGAKSQQSGSTASSSSGTGRAQPDPGRGGF